MRKMGSDSLKKRICSIIVAFSMAFSFHGCGLLWLAGNSGSGTNKEIPAQEETQEQTTDTPEANRDDLKIGDSVTFSGLTVSVRNARAAHDENYGDTIVADIRYINNTGESFSSSPYDWTCVDASDHERQYVPGKNSFGSHLIFDGDTMDDTITIRRHSDTIRIKFNSSVLNSKTGQKYAATWNIQDILPTETEAEPTTETENETETEIDITEAQTEPPAHATQADRTYILNTSTMKYHRQTCNSVDDMAEENKSEYTGKAEDVEAMGYAPCQRCHPF